MEQVSGVSNSSYVYAQNSVENTAESGYGIKDKLMSGIKQAKEDFTQKNTQYSESLIKTGLMYQGYINDNYTSLQTNLMGNTYTGVMGEEEVSLTKESSLFGFSNNISGTVGDKDVSVTIKQTLSGYSITGTIDGQEINIHKGSSLDEANGENDILTLVTSLSGHSLTVSNGEFGYMADSTAVNAKQMQQTIRDAAAYC